MSKPVYEELQEAVKERLSSPILGTIVLSLAICNWKIGLILFGGDSVDIKIQKIEVLLNISVLSGPLVHSAAMISFILFVIPGIKAWYEIYLSVISYKTISAKQEQDRMLHLEEMAGIDAVKTGIGIYDRLADAMSDAESLVGNISAIKFHTGNRYKDPVLEDMWVKYDKMLLAHLEELKKIKFDAEVFSSEYNYGKRKLTFSLDKLSRPNLPKDYN